jgi:type I restriction enzyme M protein
VFLLANASVYFVKEKPKNALTEKGIEAVADVFHSWETRDKLSRVVTFEEVREADYNLSPSLFVETNDKTHHRPLGQIVSDLNLARESRQKADSALDEVLTKLGLAVLPRQ